MSEEVSWRDGEKMNEDKVRKMIMTATRQQDWSLGISCSLKIYIILPGPCHWHRGLAFPTTSSLFLTDVLF